MVIMRTVDGANKPVPMDAAHVLTLGDERAIIAAYEAKFGQIGGTR
jgi:hypothetical protein